MESLMQVATRHMAAGVEDLDELVRLVEQDTGRVPNRRVLSAYRSHYRRHGAAWMDAFREAQRAFSGEAQQAGLNSEEDVVRMIKELRQESVVK